MNEYSSTSWHAFRNEVFRRHDYVCTSCGKRGSDDAGLHVHQKSHLVGHKPWEYPLDLCITLCNDCEVAVHGTSTPMFGWDVVGCDDLGEGPAFSGLGPGLMPQSVHLTICSKFRRHLFRKQ